MPRAVDPTEKFYVILESDAGKDLAVQPRFVYHYLTAREHRQLGLIQDKMADVASIDDVADIVFDAVKMGLIGWENITGRDGKPVAYNPDKIEDLVGLDEAQEMVTKINRQSPTGPDAQDKKKLESPSD